MARQRLQHLPLGLLQLYTIPLLEILGILSMVVVPFGLATAVALAGYGRPDLGAPQTTSP